MDLKTRSIITKVAKIENWQPIEENYRAHLAMLMGNTRRLVELPKDLKNWKELMADPSYRIIGSILVPPDIQALRTEQVRLNSLIDLYPPKQLPYEVALKLAGVKTMMNKWREVQVAGIPRLVELRKKGGELRFMFGKYWTIYVLIKKAA